MVFAVVQSTFHDMPWGDLNKLVNMPCQCWCFILSEKTAKSGICLTWCYVCLMPHSNPCLFSSGQWACLVLHVIVYPFMLLLAHMACCSLFISCSQVDINFTCQLFISMINLVKLVVIDPCLLWSCPNGVVWCMLCLLHVNDLNILSRVDMLVVLCLRRQHRDDVFAFPDFDKVWINLLQLAMLG